MTWLTAEDLQTRRDDARETFCVGRDAVHLDADRYCQDHQVHARVRRVQHLHHQVHARVRQDERRQDPQDHQDH